jgi:hypothetical protein
MDVKSLEGNWNASVSEFTFNGIAHREAFHVHDSAMNHYVFSDTDMIFKYTYILPKIISFKMKDGHLIYTQDNIIKDFISDFSKIKTGKEVVLCDSIYFTDGNYGPGLCSYGYGKLKGEFKNETIFEGNIVFENIYQRLTDHTILNYLPIYGYYINQTIPVKLEKK